MFKRIQRGRGRQFSRRVQRGRGLGGIFSTIFKAFTKAIPIAAKIAKSPIARKIGKEALKSGLRVGGEALVTNDLNSAISNELGSVKERVGRAMAKRGRASKSKSRSPKRAPKKYKKTKIPRKKKLEKERKSRRLRKR